MRFLPPESMAPSSTDPQLLLSGDDLTGLMTAVLVRGVSFRFQAKGSSMLPFIRNGDTLTVAPLGARGPKLGEVLAVVQPTGGKLLVHRMVARRKDAVLTQGDAVSQADGWAPMSSILGRVSRVEREGQSVRLGLGVERLIVVLLDRHHLWRYVLFFARLMRPWRRRVSS